MGTGILVCGLNGCGKTTLGKALAERLGFHFIDNEHLYFSGSDADDPYAISRSRTEVERLLMDEVGSHADFVFSAVKGDYGTGIVPMYSVIIAIEVPRAIRLQRVRSRSFQKFGSRMLPGGDLYAQEQAFFRMVDSRGDDYVESWLQKVKCPVVRIDGTRPISENTAYIIQAMRRLF